jgi:predicted nucleic acid-binding protein
MTTCYLDASALIKRYVKEAGTTWVRGITAAADNTILTARITMVEVYSAMARRRREGSVPPADCIVAAQAFTEHSQTEYEFVELDVEVVNLARIALDRYPLRANDAIQLASALLANTALISATLPPLLFISSDERLNAAAADEGLAVDNPNLHAA